MQYRRYARLWDITSARSQSTEQVDLGGACLPYGALAEKTVVAGDALAPIAEGVDPAVATVLGTAIAALSVKTAAGFVPGETVLVQGATGVAGRLASSPHRGGASSPRDPGDSAVAHTVAPGRLSCQPGAGFVV